MTETVTIYDQRPGAGRTFNRQIAVPSRRTTARELIQARIEAEIDAHNRAERARFAGETAAYEAGCDAPNEWLVRPGAVENALNGARRAYGPRPGLVSPEAMTLIDSQHHVAVALDAFARNGFFMIFDGRQVTDLDEVLILEAESALTFLRLVPLVGG